MRRQVKVPERSVLSVTDCEHLLEEGFVYVRLPMELDSKHLFTEFRAFMARRRSETPSERALWTVALDDPEDPDDGLFSKGARPGEDSKWVYHHSAALEQSLLLQGALSIAEDRHFFRLMQASFEARSHFAHAVARDLDRAYMGYQSCPISFLKAWRKAQHRPVPYSRDKLRLVEYIVQPGSIRRAQTHRDRSLFTLHFAQEGGGLYACRSQTSRYKESLPSKPNHAILFFGLKAELMTRSFCRALWHGADGAFGESRTIDTYFAHANYELQSTK